MRTAAALLVLVVALTSSCTAAHEPTLVEDAAPDLDAGQRIPAWRPPPRGCVDDCYYHDAIPGFGDAGEGR